MKKFNPQASVGKSSDNVTANYRTTNDKMNWQTVEAMQKRIAKRSKNDARKNNVTNYNAWSEDLNALILHCSGDTVYKDTRLW